MFEDVARDEALVDALVLVGLQVGQSLLRHAFVSGGVCSQAQLVSGWHATERGMERYIGSGSARGSGTRGRRTYSSPCLQVGLGGHGLREGKEEKKRRFGRRGKSRRHAPYADRSVARTVGQGGSSGVGNSPAAACALEERGSGCRAPPSTQGSAPATPAAAHDVPHAASLGKMLDLRAPVSLCRLGGKYRHCYRPPPLSLSAIPDKPACPPDSRAPRSQQFLCKPSGTTTGRPAATQLGPLTAG